MSNQQKYIVNVSEPESAGGAIVFTFVANGAIQERGPSGFPRHVHRFVVAVREGPNGLDFDWSESPANPGDASAEMQTEIQTRMEERAVWIKRVNELVSLFDLWAKDLGWATRRIEKKLDDARVGKHRVPALIMQADTCRIILEPVGRSAPGTEGVVDLYLMPAYDDIASLYYYGDCWNLHYSFAGSQTVPSVREAEPQRL